VVLIHGLLHHLSSAALYLIGNGGEWIILACLTTSINPDEMPTSKGGGYEYVEQIYLHLLLSA
jgi:hypothetical protein